MIISTQTDSFAHKFGEHDAIKYLAKVGFDAFDYSMFNILNKNITHPLMRADYKEYALSLRAAADEYNIICNQAHAPFPSFMQYPAEEHSGYNEIITPAIVRSMETAAILGAGIIVVHPVMLDNPAEQKKMNVEFYNNLLPYCKKYNIKIALENMWGWDEQNKKVTPAACSTGREFCEYLDALDKNWFTACLDLGHGEMQGSGAASTAELIYMLGHDRLKALHIHDNNKINDTHTLPFTGKINWDEIMTALKNINYDGDFTFEADAFLQGFPAELYLEASGLMLNTGRYFIKKYGL
ncbi:MAG: sugar phosphate isomerase/epimerase [Oscillospiraceae bacterium]|nr:sugar phosphate isomerase/epimerase [Oscillospiraceae bacterium]